MDALTDILRTIRLHTSTYFCSNFNTQWGMNIPNGKAGLFHALIEGQCWLELPNSDRAILINEGDIVAFPTGGEHRISHAPGANTLKADQVVEQINTGNNPFFHAQDDLEPSPENVWNTLLCGAFEYDSSFKHPFIKDLPCFIHLIKSETPELEWLRSLVYILSRESRVESPGSNVMADRLTEVLFIQLLRTHMGKSQQESNYLSALSDQKIGKALNLIHSEETAELSVDTLAQQVSLSRSAFSERFNRLVGEAPKPYLQRWRLEKAKRSLRENAMSTYAIALQAGYSSEAAFSKAFKLKFGDSPGKFRPS